MLLVATVADQRADYYLGDLGDELALVAPEHAPDAARWIGRSTNHIGVSGRVDEATLQGLLAGRHPRTGSPLLGRRRSVAAFDLTFAAPKSVSLLFGLGPAKARDEVVAAHRAAVGAGVDYIEERALAVRRGSGAERVCIPADGLLGASFDHGLSRAGDPHLHTHVVVANLAHGTDGLWSAIDGRGLYAHARAAGALYDAHLRAELTQRLDLSWSWHQARGWDIGGTDPMLVAAFSGRHAEISQALGTRGWSSSKARQVTWATTREPKETHRSAVELAGSWARRAEIGGARPIETEPALRPDRLDEHRFAAEISASGPSGAYRREVVAAWSHACPRGGLSDDLLAAVGHWAPSGDGSIGVAEPRCSAASCVPAPHLLRALGPRPTGSSSQPHWRAAAVAIDRYRERWGVRGPSPFGVERQGLAGLPHVRLAEHLEVTRVVREARVRIGGRAGTGLERDGLALERA